MRSMKTVKIGNIVIGNGNPIAVQSMTNVPTEDAERAICQVNELADAGCDIVRLAVPTEEAAKAMEQIVSKTSVPLVADIHFDYKLALMCMERGVHKIRINPGNIGGEDKARAVAEMAKKKGVPIRIGVNGGSLEEGLLEQCGGNLAKAMVESARRHVEILNRCDFDDIVLSMKSSSVKTTIDAYRLARETFPYPLHLGVTEAGTLQAGIVKSAIGIGSLLADGIGDTIRVSLTDNPVREPEVARRILRALDLDKDHVEVVSCPTCGRTKIDLIPIAQAVSDAVEKIPANLKVAVMGCVVNGPGEAKDADVGIAGGDGCAVLFKKGEIVRKIKEEEIVSTLLEEIQRMAE
ncbi:MAG: flavodoxin-dependent (E)-4-hydroxy-3-methylbut-2-enyl-diphosphate synthase [Clostridia bacterium]|nr:flavodoxin-dependent (E)-4-hydroxy-3-methylbut-2-enyl-diphosphate synthase [Clostridia bacterium]